MLKTAGNVPGCDIVIVNNINANILAPGCHPGRLTLWSDAAIEVLAKEKLFMIDYKGPNKEAKEIKKVDIRKKSHSKPRVKKVVKKPEASA